LALGGTPLAAQENGAQSGQAAGQTAGQTAAPSLEQTRLVLGKWLETQKVIAHERNDWQQGKELLAGRLELVQKQLATLDEKTRVATASVAETDKKSADLQVENEQLKATSLKLAGAVTALEAQLRTLMPSLPPPVQEGVRQLWQRVPEDPTRTHVTVAERFQNVLVILAALNKANTEINVVYEVHQLADGKPAEVQTIYLGLAQAWYVSAGGDAGIGRPTPTGWKWEPVRAIAQDVLNALEIKQGKQTPTFVPLPVRIQ
jgi:hypothetical protein